MYHKRVLLFGCFASQTPAGVLTGKAWNAGISFLSAFLDPRHNRLLISVLGRSCDDFQNDLEQSTEYVFICL